MSFNLTADNDRRSGTDRRRYLYLVLTPERRSGKDRRNTLGKRSTKIKFTKDRHDLK